MRWADLDSLNHVNNVVYLDYAAESRALLVEDGLLDDRPVQRIAIDFLRSLLLSSHPVQVRSTVDGSELVQEIRAQGADAVFARLTTTYGDAVELAPQAGAGDPLPLRVRRSDLDLTGAVSTTRTFGLFQESRVLFLSQRLTSMTPGRFVVGHVEVSYAGPLSWRTRPYEAHNWVSRVGSSSVTVESQLADGDVVLAQCRSVLVGFDLESQRSRRLSDTEKDEFGALSPRC